jgi:hypothetical protein
VSCVGFALFAALNSWIVLRAFAAPFWTADPGRTRIRAFPAAPSAGEPSSMSRKR